MLVEPHTKQSDIILAALNAYLCILNRRMRVLSPSNHYKVTQQSLTDKLQTTKQLIATLQ